ncbi:MAG: DivIVA domain-containing protein [Ruminococcaceae bacterium]|nr:DivIVA domain-containing protein [Oscillospiraceae bacterium]
MFTSKEIQDSVFSTAMSGYKRDEVDTLLDKIAEDYKQFEAVLNAQQTKIAELEKELKDRDVSMSSINSVLISAQKLADNIVEDAKLKADEMIDTANNEAENIKLRTKKALEEIDAVLTEQKNKAQAEVDIMLSDAARKSEGMILAAKDSVTREQLLFDKLKSEVAEFKKQIKESYKNHIESLSKLPDEVVLSPEIAASKIEDIINNEPDLLKFIDKDIIQEPTPEIPVEPIDEPEVFIDDATVEFTAISEKPEEVLEQTAPSGFVIQGMEEDEPEAEDFEEEPPTFSKGFFAKK